MKYFLKRFSYEMILNVVNKEKCFLKTKISLWDCMWSVSDSYTLLITVLKD